MYFRPAITNTVMEGHHAEIRAYEDLKDKLEDVIDAQKKAPTWRYFGLFESKRP